MQVPLTESFGFRVSTAILALCYSLWTACSQSGAAEDAPDAMNQNLPVAAQATTYTGTLKVLTLNIAHGRKDAFNQMFLGKATIGHNLDDIVALIARTRPDIVALQEADGPSRWSGSFDHVATIAGKAGYPWIVRGSHAENWLHDYGTALLSRQPFTQTTILSFTSTPPTPTKGLVLGQIAVQPDPASPARLVDAVSLHLDFSRARARNRQIAEVRTFLASRKQPVIILGDFNSDWFSDHSVVTQLAAECGLHTYRPMANDLGTYRSGSRRFDWILLSQELQFVDYRVLADEVSDHSAVVADIRITDVDEDNNRRAGCAG